MAGWHHRLDAHEFGWTPGVGDGQGGLACCNSWGRKESDTTERLNWTERIVPIQGLNPGLPDCRIPSHLSYQGSPRMLEWVAYPFSRRSSQPRNQTRVSCIAGRFFTSWATREALFAPNDTLAKSEAKADRIEGKNNSIIIVGDFNTPIIDRMRPKISKEIESVIQYTN